MGGFTEALFVKVEPLAEEKRGMRNQPVPHELPDQLTDLEIQAVCNCLAGLREIVTRQSVLVEDMDFILSGIEETFQSLALVRSEIR